MAISKNNIVTETLSGKVGNIIFKNYSNKTVISKYPDMSKVVKTERQKDNQILFKAAQAYATSILSDPEKKQAFIKTIPKGQIAYHAAISKYLKENKSTQQAIQIADKTG
ncbi:MAG: hypothetical protein EOO91_06470 [Pedobacter sp.]|nr:MAG: hypothetical protein EOO91_06470 [Pedobacter sp.]